MLMKYIKKVSQRDQMIFKLQTEYSSMQEKYSNALEENKIEHEELERLNSRIRQQSQDLDEMRFANDCLETKRGQLEKEIKQMQYDYEVCQQELLKRDKQIENIKFEWTTSIKNHEEEVRSYKQSYQILNDELTHTKNELREVLSKINDLKLDVNLLNNELEGKKDELASARNEISRLDGVCRDYDNKLYSFTNELSAARGQLENSSSEIDQLRERLKESQTLYDRAADSINELEHSVKFHEETVSDCKSKVSYLYNSNFQVGLLYTFFVNRCPSRKKRLKR